jgi:hypothetical protein
VGLSNPFCSPGPSDVRGTWYEHEENMKTRNKGSKTKISAIYSDKKENKYIIRWHILSSSSHIACKTLVEMKNLLLQG